MNKQSCNLLIIIGAIIILFSLCLVIKTEKHDDYQRKIFLHTKQTKETIPLKSIFYDVKIKDSVSRTKITQEYENTLTEKLEVEYLFPISAKAVFDKFEAKIGNRIIYGLIKEKSEARAEYTENLEKGNTVAYAEKIDSVNDIMKVNLGNLLPGETISLSYSYIEELDVFLNTHWQLIIPTALTERFTPANSNFNIPNIQNINPNEKNAYYIDFTIEIDSSSPINSIKVPTHSDLVDYTFNKSKKLALIRKKKSERVLPNKDLIILYDSEDMLTSSYTIERYNDFKNINTSVIKLNYFPQFNDLTPNEVIKFLDDNEYSNTYRELNEKTSSSPMEFIFICDRSGSMKGERIKNLRYSVREFLKWLPKNSFFNIVSFGSDFKYMFPTSKKVQDFAYIADLEVSNFKADFGGTNILSPMESALNFESLNLPRMILMFTDGDVNNADQIIHSARINRSKARIHSIGIGSGVNNDLVMNISKASNGNYIFVKDENLISEKAKYLINSIVSPYLDKAKVEIITGKELITNTYPEMNNIPYLTKNQQFSYYIFLDNERLLKNELETNNSGVISIEIEFYNSFLKKNITEKLEIKVSDIIQSNIDDSLHKLAVNNIINDLIWNTNVIRRKNYEEANLIEKEILELSVKYQILCDRTAFIMLIKENEKDDEVKKIKKVNIPGMGSVDYQAENEMMNENLAYNLLAFDIDGAPKQFKESTKNAHAQKKRGVAKMMINNNANIQASNPYSIPTPSKDSISYVKNSTLNLKINLFLLLLIFFLFL